MTGTIRPVILCGGNGTRLWPLSTPERPKQFLNLLGEKTMLEMTLDRARGHAPDGLAFGRPLVIGSAKHQDWIKSLSGDADILLEPVGRNSAAPIAAATLASASDDVLLVLPADHDIRDVQAFHSALAKAFGALKPGTIATFGIVAATPETGYGYIEAAGSQGDVRKVARFVEKPDLETARSYVASGKFFWNAGIFMFRARDMIAAFEAHAPDILKTVRASMPEGFGVHGASKEGMLTADVFSDCRAQSIDFAIIEHHAALSVVPVEMGWSDIGNFNALWDRSPKDENGNVLIGDVKAPGCRNSYIRAVDGRICVSGLDSAVVVKAGGEVMVCNMENVQTVGQLAGR